MGVRLWLRDKGKGRRRRRWLPPARGRGGGHEEVETVADMPGRPTIGCHSHGDICPRTRFAHLCELHDQTTTLTITGER